MYTQPDDFRTIQHACTEIRGGADIGQAQTRVVRRRVRIEGARTQPVEPERRNPGTCLVDADEPVDAGSCEERVDNDSALQKEGWNGPPRYRGSRNGVRLTR